MLRRGYVPERTKLGADISSRPIPSPNSAPSANSTLATRGMKYPRLAAVSTVDQRHLVITQVSRTDPPELASGVNQVRSYGALAQKPYSPTRRAGGGL